MNKFWMMGAAMITLSVAAIAWNTQPVRSSESLLAKAQSEFAVKARDVLIQRQMVQTSNASAAVSVSRSLSSSSYGTESLGPVAVPPVAASDAAIEASISEPETTTVASVDAPASREEVRAPASSANPAREETVTAKVQIASLQENVQVSEPPAPASELANADARRIAPTRPAPQREFKAERKTERKTRQAHKQPRTNASAPYFSQDLASRHLGPRDIAALRAHAPQIAAAIARYMNQ